jgi:hypothetical protein
MQRSQMLKTGIFCRNMAIVISVGVKLRGRQEILRWMVMD